MGIPVSSEDLSRIKTVNSLDTEYNLPTGGAEKIFNLEDKHDLPRGLLLATITNETGTQTDRAKAVNPDSGAEGWMQFLPKTAKAYNVNTKDFESSINGAAQMFSDLKKQYKGNTELMLAGYNWGSGNISEQGIENMPPETKKYISKAQEIMNKIKDTYYGLKSKLVPLHDIPKIYLLSPHEGSTHDKKSELDNPFIIAQSDVMSSANREAYYRDTGERISGDSSKTPVPENKIQEIEKIPPGYISTPPSSNLSGLIKAKIKGGMTESQAIQWAKENGIK